MASSSKNTNNSAPSPSASKSNPSINLPAAALVPYKSVWDQIETYIKTKSCSEALLLSCVEAEAFADFEKGCHGAFNIMIGNAIRPIEELSLYKLMTEDLRKAYVEHVVWNKIGCSMKKRFPGDLSGVDAFLIWYSEECRELVLDEEKGKGKGKEEEVEKEEKKETGDGSKGELDHGHEYPEKYADGEDEEADGGVPLFWT